MLCGRRSDNMNMKSRNLWVWYNDTSIICKEHINYNRRNGLDDPRPSQIDTTDNELTDTDQTDSQFVQNESVDQQTDFDHNINEQTQELFSSVNINNQNEESEIEVGESNAEDDDSLVDEREYCFEEEAEGDSESETEGFFCIF